MPQTIIYFNLLARDIHPSQITNANQNDLCGKCLNLLQTNEKLDKFEIRIKREREAPA